MNHADVLLVVALYLAFTAPFLPLLLAIHGLRSDYTRVFQAALVLQLVPIGLVFWPLGILGLALLIYSLAMAVRRNRRFRAAGFDNPEVHRAWTREYLVNVAACAFAIEQKATALLFLEAVNHRASASIWLAFAAGSLLLWVVTGLLLRREWWAIARPSAPQA